VSRSFTGWRSSSWPTWTGARQRIAPWVSPAFVATDLESARAVLQRYADKWAWDAGGIWGVWLDGRLVGGVMFVSFDVALGACEAGCWR
jgi:ribosomal-protein-serine acetyltransferase